MITKPCINHAGWGRKAEVISDTEHLYRWRRSRFWYVVGLVWFLESCDIYSCKLGIYWLQISGSSLVPLLWFLCFFPCIPSSNPSSRIPSWQQGGSLLLFMSKIMGIALNFPLEYLDFIILVNGKLLLVCPLNPQSLPTLLLWFPVIRTSSSWQRVPGI